MPTYGPNIAGRGLALSRQYIANSMCNILPILSISTRSTPDSKKAVLLDGQVSASGLRTVKSQPRRRGAEATKASRQHRTPSAPRGTHARAAENEKGSGGPPEDAEQGLKGSRLTGARARAAGLKGAQVPGRSGADLRGPFDREARPRL